jgi:hypothetical protein
LSLVVDAHWLILGWTVPLKTVFPSFISGYYFDIFVDIFSVDSLWFLLYFKKHIFGPFLCGLYWYLPYFFSFGYSQNTNYSALINFLYNVFWLPTITPPTPVRASLTRWVGVRIHVYYWACKGILLCYDVTIIGKALLRNKWAYSPQCYHFMSHFRCYLCKKLFYYWAEWEKLYYVAILQ